MATNSKISICNIALAMLGEDGIRSFDEVNKRARMCDIFYDSAVSYLMAKFDWPFARRYKSLKQVDLDDLPEGINAFQIPADCRTPRDINEPGSKDQWEVFGDYIYTPVDIVNLYYTTNDVSVTRFSDTFVSILALGIAVRMGPSITQDKALVKVLYERFTGEVREAHETDANIGNTYREFNEDPNNDSFVYPDGFLEDYIKRPINIYT